MKKRWFTAVQIVLPSVLIAGLSRLLHDQGGKHILDGWYILFPLLFLLMGLMGGRIWIRLGALVLSTLTFLVAMRIFYPDMTMLDMAAIYWVIAAIGYGLRRLVGHLFGKSKKQKKA